MLPKSNGILFRYDDPEPTNRTPAFLRRYFKDEEGWEIFQHWFDGRGMPVNNIDDPMWTNYMMANPKLRGELLVYLRAHTDLWVLKNSGSFTLHMGLATNPLGGDSWWFIGDNYSSGYELLHQPAYNQYGADAFVMEGDAAVTVSDEEYTIHYNNRYTWVDYCQPNPTIPRDVLEAFVIKGLAKTAGAAVGQAYTRTITWHAPADIKAKIDANGHIMREYQHGWPFDAGSGKILR